MACELTAWMAMLALDGPARAWEPKRLRLRLFTAAGRIVRGGRLAAVAPRPDLALGQPGHRRDHPPASLRSRLTSPNRPSHPERRPKGPWNPHTRRDSRAVRHDRTLKAANGRRLGPTAQDHETSRLSARLDSGS